MKRPRDTYPPISLQVLLSTMRQHDTSLVERMRITSDSLIINQSAHGPSVRETRNGSTIQMLTLPERGIGLSRNTALDRATGDLCLFADDDVEYVKNYQDLVIREFQRLPRADIILFNLTPRLGGRSLHASVRRRRLWLGSLRAGMPRVAARTSSLHSSGIRFSLDFGGGSPYSAGEDTLFLLDCLRRGLAIYSAPVNIGTIDLTESSWYQGITLKYLRDRGALFHAMSHRLWKLLVLRFALRHRQSLTEAFSLREAVSHMMSGGREYKCRQDAPVRKRRPK